MLTEARYIAEEVKLVLPKLVLPNQGEVAECAPVGVGVTPVVDEGLEDNFYCRMYVDDMLNVETC